MDVTVSNGLKLCVFFTHQCGLTKYMVEFHFDLSLMYFDLLLAYKKKAKFKFRKLTFFLLIVFHSYRLKYCVFDTLFISLF